MYETFCPALCISKIRYYNDEIEKMNHAIRLYVKESHDAQLLLTITGIDVFTAALVASEIDGIKRFASPKKLVSWSGMCPTTHQSGDTAYHGRMKKDSNRKVNWVITQCALSAAVHDPRMKAYYEHLKKKKAQAKCCNNSCGQQDDHNHLVHADQRHRIHRCQEKPLQLQDERGNEHTVGFVMIADHNIA